jgi:uncharacterized protein YabE (DUF348 family)
MGVIVGGQDWRSNYMHNKILRKKRQFEAVANHRHVRRLRIWARHPVALPVGIFFGLVLLTGIVVLILGGKDKVIATDSKVVIVAHDHIQQTVPTREPTVGALLDKLNIHLNDGDVVEPSPETAINQDDFRINVYRAVPVEIVDGDKKTYAFSAATTPRSITAQAGIEVNPADYLNTLPTSNFLREGAIGERVVIDRAIPVHLNLYGTPITMWTHAKTVGGLLRDNKIKLATQDSLQPEADTPITPYQLIFILRKGVKVVSTHEVIPMPVQTKYDAGLAFGEQAVRQKGSPGERVVTYQIKTQNGKEVSRTVLQTIISQPAVAQIVVIGTSLSGIKGDMRLAGIAPGDYNYADYIISHESGWCPTKAQGQVGSCPAYAGSVPSYGGYGLCQSTPGSKMASAGPDWATNPITQLRWCSGYAQSKYGGWAGAYNFWYANHYW